MESRRIELMRLILSMSVSMVFWWAIGFGRKMWWRQVPSQYFYTGNGIEWLLLYLWAIFYRLTSSYITSMSAKEIWCDTHQFFFFVQTYVSLCRIICYAVLVWNLTKAIFWPNITQQLNLLKNFPHAII